eukprot:3731702-Amphidinium_carterae.1
MAFLNKHLPEVRNAHGSLTWAYVTDVVTVDVIETCADHYPLCLRHRPKGCHGRGLERVSYGGCSDCSHGSAWQIRALQKSQLLERVELRQEQTQNNDSKIVTAVSFTTSELGWQTT